MTLIGTILDKIRDALVQDTTFKAWTEHEDNFGKHPLVFIGEDDDNPPDRSNHPLVCVCSINRAESGHKDVVSFEIGFYASVSNRGIEKDDDDNPKYFEYSGFKQAEELREQAERAIARVIMKTEGWLFEGDGKTVPDNMQGIYSSHSEIRISIKQRMIKPFYNSS